MANTSSSLEMQIDNFLEHFKRSASKAMDTDWTTTNEFTSSGYANAMATSETAAAVFNHSSPLKTTKTRSSCFDISSMSGITFNRAFMDRIIRVSSSLNLKPSPTEKQNKTK